MAISFRSFSRFLRLTLVAVGVSLWMGVVSVFAATYTVDTLTDAASDSSCVDGDVSFRDAVSCAEANAGEDTIAFSVSGTITLTANGPSIAATDAAGAVLNCATNITFDGNAGTYKGIRTGSSSVIKGCTFTNMNEASIYADGNNNDIGGTGATERNVIRDAGVDVAGNNNLFRNNFIGVQSDGTTGDAGSEGIIVQSGTGNTIGGNTTADSNNRNLIVSQSNCGILARSGIGTLDVYGNYIGVNRNGNSALANFTAGICFDSGGTYASEINIGSIDGSGYRNIISGNTGDGILVRGTFSNTFKIINNYIGTYSTGGTALANGSDGIDISTATCSGTCRISSNLISGNTTHGVYIHGSSSGFSVGTANYIGINKDGDTALANGSTGITIDSSSSNTIGSSDGTLDAPNIISGNTSHGIAITGSTASSNSIIENYIGFNAAGSGVVANGGDGVNINGSGTVTLGIAASPSTLNIIVGNTGDGIEIASNAGAIGIYSTLVGVSQSTDYGNGEDGIQFSGSPAAVVTIGGGSTGPNLISGNAGYGINIAAGNSHVIKGNFIGTNKDVDAAVANDSGGINIAGGSSTTIGGTTAGDGNVIAGHGGAGDYDITVGASASGVGIYGNYIGMTDGGVTIASANGILVQGSTTTIGSSVADGVNVIGGHTGTASVHFNGATTATLKNAQIGFKPDFTASTSVLPLLINSNGGTAPSNITIGGTGNDDLVWIGNGTTDGVRISSGSNISFLATNIGINPSGTDMGNGDEGISIEGGSSIYLGRNVAGSSYSALVIVGNTGHGIELPAGGTASGVYIANAHIGVRDADSTYAAMGNGGSGISVSSGSTVVVGGTATDDLVHLSSNTGDGITINGVSGVTVRRSYIGTTALGANRGNGGYGVNIQDSSPNAVIGHAFGETISLSSSTGYANRIGYNTSADVLVDGSSSTGVSLRGNIFDLSGTDTNTNISLAHSANSGVSLSGTSLTTKNTSRVLGSTGFAADSKVDIYSLTAAYAITYEGTATVASGVFQLDKDFTATSSDEYFYQIAEADGDTTALSSQVTVDADSTAPTAPTASSSTLTNTAAYTLSGAKDAYSSILSGGSSIVAIDSAATWTYATTLTEGSNTYSLTSKDYSNNVSSATSFSVTLDTIAPAAPTLTSSNEIQSSATTHATTLTGTKDANTNVLNNGTQILGSDASTTWSYGYTLSQGVNTFALTSSDLAGNISSSNAFSIRLTAPVAGGGGTGGSGGSSSSSSGTGTSGSSSDSVSHAPTEDSQSTAGESESTGHSDGAMSGESDSSTVEESSPVVVEQPAPTIVSTPAPAPVKPVVIQPAPVIVEETKDLYPAEDETIDDSEEVEEEEKTSSPEAVSYDIATYVAVPVATVTRTAILENTDYQKITPVDDAGIPVWIQEKFSVSEKEDKVITKDSDLDGDGILDAAEILLGTRLDRKDSDGDGISDDKELAKGTNPTLWDSDGDGISDRDEARGGTNPNDRDSDKDGVSDAEEVSAGSDPMNANSKPRIDTQGVPEDWLKKYRDLKDVKYGELQKIKGIEKEIKLTFAMTDTDGDGLSDQDEYKLGTNPTRSDTDRDGVLDGAEVHDYQTDPTRDTKTDSFYSAKASNLKPGTNTFAGAPVMRGTAQPNSTVEVIFLPKNKESPTAWNLFASLFGVDTNGAITEKVQTDSTGKFLARPEVKDGDYTVVVRSLDANGSITEESLPYEVQVDRALEDNVVTPRQLDTETIDVENLQLITIANNRPYLYGTAKKGYEVVTSWQSQLYTSSLLVDTDEGEFVTVAPANLESGDHDLYVYAVEPSKNLSTSLISIDFNVLGAALYGASDEAVDGKASLFASWKLWVGLGVPLLLVLILAVRRKKPAAPSVSN